MLHSGNVCIIKKGKKVILIVLIREFRFKCPSRFPGSAALPDNWPVSTPIANEMYGHFARVLCCRTTEEAHSPAGAGALA